MSKPTTTLKQIAETAGVSITTVHRVMNGKEGCGEELRRRDYGDRKTAGV